MEIEQNSNPLDYIPGLKIEEPESLKKALEPHESYLIDCGWKLFIKDKEAGIYRTFKNGKLRKTADIYIQFHEFSKEYFIDINGNFIESAKSRERPWYVRSNVTDQSSSLKRLSKAIDRFIHFSKEAAGKLSLKN